MEKAFLVNNLVLEVEFPSQTWVDNEGYTRPILPKQDFSDLN